MAGGGGEGGRGYGWLWQESGVGGGRVGWMGCSFNLGMD